MIAGKQQRDEIATIKPRTLQLKLSDADVIRLSEKAEIAGLTVAGLLESFIGDLVDGTYTNGSDEREWAQAWYNRCGYGYDGYSSFTGFLLTYDLYEEYEELADMEDDCQFEIESGENDPEEVTEFLIDLKDTQARLAEIYTEYGESMQRKGQQPATNDQCKEDFRRYRKALRAFQRSEGG